MPHQPDIHWSFSGLRRAQGRVEVTNDVSHYILSKPTESVNHNDIIIVVYFTASNQRLIKSRNVWFRLMPLHSSRQHQTCRHVYNVCRLNLANYVH